MWPRASTSKQMNMEQLPPERIQWRENHDAIELGFDFYLEILERRLKGQRLSLVQSLRKFYEEELGIDLRETQARGLMHRSSSVFIDYVKDASGSQFTPGIQFWEAQGLEQFLQWRDSFHRIRYQKAADIEGELQEPLLSLTDDTSGIPRRQQGVINRIIRDSALSRFLKSLYNYRCQVCRFSFTLPSGVRYAESHHVKPLGRRHGGIDKETNMMILCPNHHAMMDLGVIAIDPYKLVLLSITESYPYYGQPLGLQRHPINKEFLEYHLINIFNKVL